MACHVGRPQHRLYWILIWSFLFKTKINFIIAYAIVSISRDNRLCNRKFSHFCHTYFILNCIHYCTIKFDVYDDVIHMGYGKREDDAWRLAIDYFITAKSSPIIASNLSNDWPF